MMMNGSLFDFDIYITRPGVTSSILCAHKSHHGYGRTFGYDLWRVEWKMTSSPVLTARILAQL